MAGGIVAAVAVIETDMTATRATTIGSCGAPEGMLTSGRRGFPETDLDVPYARELFQGTVMRVPFRGAAASSSRRLFSLENERFREETA